MIIFSFDSLEEFKLIDACNNVFLFRLGGLERVAKPSTAAMLTLCRLVFCFVLFFQGEYVCVDGSSVTDRNLSNFA